MNNFIKPLINHKTLFFGMFTKKIISFNKLNFLAVFLDSDKKPPFILIEIPTSYPYVFFQHAWLLKSFYKPNLYDKVILYKQNAYGLHPIPDFYNKGRSFDSYNFISDLKLTLPSALYNLNTYLTTFTYGDHKMLLKVPKTNTHYNPPAGTFHGSGTSSKLLRHKITTMKSKQENPNTKVMFYSRKRETRNEENLLKVFVYNQSNEKNVRKMITAELNDDASIKPPLNLGFIQKSSIIEIKVLVKNAIIKDSTFIGPWEEETFRHEFIYKVKKNFKGEKIIFEVLLTINQSQIKKFYVDVDLTKIHRVVSKQAPVKVFVSYAHKDFSIVNKYLALKKSKEKQLFYDYDKSSMTNDSEGWLVQIHNKIIECDLFWLFWSKNTIKSKFVNHEITFAKDTKLESEIYAHKLEEKVPIPKEISHRHFLYIKPLLKSFRDSKT